MATDPYLHPPPSLADAEGSLAARPRALAAMRRTLEIFREGEARDPELARAISAALEEMVIEGEPWYREAEAFLRAGGPDAAEELAPALLRTLTRLVAWAIHPLLLDLLARRRIARGKRPAPDRMAAIHLTYAVEELSVTTPLRDLMEPAPWGLRLPDWCTMPEFLDAPPGDGRIHLRLRTARDEITLRYTRGELLDVLAAVLDLAVGIGVARAVAVHGTNAEGG